MCPGSTTVFALIGSGAGAVVSCCPSTGASAGKSATEAAGNRGSFSADSTTFIGELYSLLGLRNVADGAEGDSGGFPQLNAEFLVSANPDMIFLADTKCCAETAETVAARPGWDVIAGVVNGNVFEMDDDIASRWGPRVVDYLREVSDAVGQALG